MTNLLSLPNELLQNIASYLTCSSALSLVRVNRQLRNACNDRLVFHSIARYNLELPLLASHGIEVPRTDWAEGDAILTGASFNETVRLAYAAEKCIQALLAQDDNTWTLRISNLTNSCDLSNWLPHMMLLQHPAAQAIRPEIFLQVQGKLQMQLAASMPSTVSAPLTDFINVNLVMVYAMLVQLHSTLDPQEQKKAFDRSMSASQPTGAPNYVTHGLGTNSSCTLPLMRQRIRNYQIFSAQFSADQALALLPVFLLELASPLPTGAALLSELPVASKMAFTASISIPPVFHRTTRTTESLPLGTSHLATMCTPAFLSGKWTGYYSDHRNPRHTMTMFDPPMRDINMIARPQPPSSSYCSPHARNAAPPHTPTTHMTALIDRETRGVDGHGEFRLQGQVYADGSVRLVKSYIVHGWSWRWAGCVTPFGIVGVWGGDGRGGGGVQQDAHVDVDVDDDDEEEEEEEDQAQYFGGYFWIWKNEWCAA